MSQIPRNCPVCEGFLIGVNYCENDNNNIESTTYVMMDGARMCGRVQKFICGQCSNLQTFLVED
jgi:hypothetical protein